MRIANENHAKARSEERPNPKSEGRVIKVDWGSGSPEQMVRWMRGSVQHDVARTELCMKSAKPRVLTAR